MVAGREFVYGCIRIICVNDVAKQEELMKLLVHIHLHGSHRSPFTLIGRPLNHSNSCEIVFSLQASFDYGKGDIRNLTAAVFQVHYGSVEVSPYTSNTIAAISFHIPQN